MILDVPELVGNLEDAIDDLRAAGWWVGISNNALIVQKHPPGEWNERDEWFRFAMPNARIKK